MGAVLEMKRISLGLAVALSLAGCANLAGISTGPAGADRGTEGQVLSTVGRIGRVLGGINSNNGVGARRTVPGGFAPEAIAAEPGAYRLVQINALGVAEPARVIQDNGGEITIALQSGPTAAFDNGVLVATRGFGDDLFTLDSRGVLEVLRAGGGTLSRRMETLDAQDQIRTSTFACTIVAAGSESVDLGLRELSLRRFDENCRSEALVIDNIYWVDDAGRIAASRQFVSPTVAYLRVNAL